MVNLQFKSKNRMSLAIKLLLIFLLVYLVLAWITKPFRDVIKKAKQAAEQQQSSRQEKYNNKTKHSSDTKTEELGEYIDYEEIED